MSALCKSRLRAQRYRDDQDGKVAIFMAAMAVCVSLRAGPARESRFVSPARPGTTDASGFGASHVLGRKPPAHNCSSEFM